MREGVHANFILQSRNSWVESKEFKGIANQSPKNIFYGILWGIQGAKRTGVYKADVVGRIRWVCLIVLLCQRFYISVVKFDRTLGWRRRPHTPLSQVME